MTGPQLIQALQSQLDPGEAEAIALAIELGTRGPVLLDDRKARRVASSIGLIVLGSAGVLLAAKQVGLIRSVRPVLDNLRTAGLYLSEPAYRRVLVRAEE